jgi:SAM-dependent methyltransferase
MLEMQRQPPVRRGGQKCVTGPASSRGERLYPPASSRIYWHLTRLRQEIERIIASYVASRAKGLLLDYGCGNMPYRRLFEDHVASYVGCDFPGNEIADRLLNSARELPFAAETADYVLSTQVLEHVDNPDSYLRECWRVLSTDGLLILSTHGVWQYHPDPTDYWRWTSQGLKRIVEDIGFTVVNFQGIMGPGAAGLQLWQDATIRKLHWRLIPFFTRVMQYFIRRADMGCSDDVRNRDASVFVLVARKNATIEERCQ